MIRLSLEKMKKMEKFWDQSIAQMGSGMSPPRDDLTFQPDYVYFGIYVVGLNLIC